MFGVSDFHLARSHVGHFRYIVVLHTKFGMFVFDRPNRWLHVAKFVLDQWIFFTYIVCFQVCFCHRLFSSQTAGRGQRIARITTLSKHDIVGSNQHVIQCSIHECTKNLVLGAKSGLFRFIAHGITTLAIQCMCNVQS